MPVDSEQIAYLRLLLAEPYAPQSPQPDVTGYLFSSDQLQILLNFSESITRAAQVGWECKAAYFQSLVDVEESGASRKLSQMFRNAVQMVDRFKLNADDEADRLANAVRTTGVAGSPWGVQRVWQGQFASTYLIGDVSRAGAGGTIFFIEVPVDSDILTENAGVPSVVPSAPGAVLPTREIIVPTTTRWALPVESGRSLVRWYDYYDAATGLQVDNTGWTAVLTAYGPTNAVLTTVNLTTDLSNHRFVLSLTPTQTTAFSFATGEYEIVVTDASGNVLTLVVGTMTVTGIQ